MTQYITYFRVSTRRQAASGLGLEAQQSSVASFLGPSPDIMATYQETESGKRADRPQLKLALDHCKRSRASLVMAKVDRLTRSLSFLLSVLDSGVELVFCDMPQLNGPQGRFILQQMASVAELEAGMISARTKAALAAAKARGTIWGGCR